MYPPPLPPEFSKSIPATKSFRYVNVCGCYVIVLDIVYDLKLHHSTL